jgi:hypothetical protein
MIDQLVLSIVLLKEPMKCRTDEHDQVVCFYSNSKNTEVANAGTGILCATVTTSSEQPVVSVTDFSAQEDFALLTVAERFQKLATKWFAETQHISSTTEIAAHPSYQQIIRMGWDVVPLLLIDLRQNKRFWFPALSAITGIRPFDRSDAGNGKRMTDAWITWGQKKGLIQ